MEKARGQIAKLIGVDDKEVIYTSGATELNNLAIRGVAGFPTRTARTTSSRP